MEKLETIIGLEIHLQLKTKSKMFCSCSNDGENQPPNTLICPICLGHPGTLPTVNEEAIKQGMAMALALNCRINLKSKFDRKNYFYPDLPKGYQISQFDEPLAEDGYLMLQTNSHKTKINIERLHLEEDAARGVGEEDGKKIFRLDRLGIPLVEVVTAPDIKDAEHAKEVALQIGDILRSCKVKEGLEQLGKMLIFLFVVKTELR